jgi:hypothetical protein
MGSKPTRPNDPHILRLVAEGARVGLTYELIAKHAGIATSTLYRWAKLGREGSKKHRAFSEALDSNETRGAVSCLARIHQAAQAGDWKAAAWLMERRHGYTIQRASLPPAEPETTVDRQALDVLLDKIPVHVLEARARKRREAGE